jgi:hypothetical protein
MRKSALILASSIAFISTAYAGQPVPLQELQDQLAIAHARTAEAEARYNRIRKETRYGTPHPVIRNNWRTGAEIEYETAVSRERMLHKFVEDFAAQPPPAAAQSGCRPHYLAPEQLQKAFEDHDAWCDKVKREGTASGVVLYMCEPDAPVTMYREGC